MIGCLNLRKFVFMGEDFIKVLCRWGNLEVSEYYGNFVFGLSIMSDVMRGVSCNLKVVSRRSSVK